MPDLFLISLSGLSLLLLYPIGLLTTGTPFLLFFILHLAVHSIALGFCWKTISKTFPGSGESRLLQAIGIIIPLLLLILLGFAPVVTRDALIHHLAVPKFWIAKGYIYEVPWHEWSYYPMLLQLGFLGFLKLGAPPLTSIYHGSFLLMLAALVIHTLRAQNTPVKLLQLGAILSLTTPLLFRLGASPYVDLPLAVYALGAFFLVTRDKETLSITSLLLLSTLLGLTAGVKYNGLLFSILALGVFIPAAKFSQRITYRGILLTCGIFLLIASPWYLKNLAQTGNPVFPLLGGFFPNHDPLRIIPVGAASTIPYPKLFTEPLRFFSIPFQMIFFGKDDTASGFDGALSPLLLFFVLSPMLKKFRSTNFLGLLLLFGYSYAALELSGPRVRYLLPIIGIWIVLSITGIRALTSRFSQTTRDWTFILLVLFQCFTGLWYGAQLITTRNITPYLLGNISATTYQNQQVTESLLADAINTTLPENAKVYLLYTGNRYFLYDRAVTNSGYFSDRQLLFWIRNSEKTSIQEALHKAGITHIALHKKRYERTFRDYETRHVISEVQMTNWNQFVSSQLALKYEIGPYIIGEVK